MKLIRRSRRNSAEVNAGSMADIAFLLLIFFLVTTTIVIDQGIAVKLPPWSDEDPMMTKIPSRNIFRIEKVKSEIRRAINKSFIENNITIPFPQMDVHFNGEVKK